MLHRCLKLTVAGAFAAFPSLALSQTPTQSGQAAYAAISEVVRILEADPNTDWSKVNVEALRQHLIDMDEVTLNSSVVQRAAEGGLEMDVTGMGRAVPAIRRLVASHARSLDGSVYHLVATEIPNGTRLRVTASDSKDAKTVARIRGLGFAGIITEGNHHALHHIAVARGEDMSHMH